MKILQYSGENNKDFIMKKIAVLIIIFFMGIGPMQMALVAAEVVESRIDGDFEGWEGETIVKLVNGQIWQQDEYYYHYHYAYMPEVVVYQSGSSYKMKVDGVDKAVRVKRQR